MAIGCPICSAQAGLGSENWQVGPGPHGGRSPLRDGFPLPKGIFFAQGAQRDAGGPRAGVYGILPLE
jgi:hypothetical protein